MITKEFCAAMIAVICAVLIVPTAYAADKHNTSTGAAAAGQSAALGGNDPAALASDLRIQPGQVKFAVAHDGVAD